MRPAWLRLVLPLVALAGLAVLVVNTMVAGRQGKAPEGGAGAAAPLAVGRPLPDFSLPLLQGGTVTAAQLRGKPAIVNFWASWCGPCQEEMPALDDLARRGGAHVLAVNWQEHPAVARDFVTRNGYRLTVALDESGDLYAAWGFRVLPTSVVTDAEGRVCGVYEGALDRETFAALVERAGRGCGG